MEQRHYVTSFLALNVDVFIYLFILESTMLFGRDGPLKFLEINCFTAILFLTPKPWD